jgi:hypothetical protein
MYKKKIPGSLEYAIDLNGTIVATGLDPINRSDYQDKSKPFSKILIVKPDGTKIVAESIRQAAKIISLQARTITRYLNTGGTCTKGNIYRSLE